MVYLLELPLISPPLWELVKRDLYGKQGRREHLQKVFDRQRNYLNEIECYEILESYEVSEIKGFTIPKLIGFDDELWIIELSIVAPPYLLDFGKASAWFPPRFTAEQMSEYETERKQLFGGNWELVRAVIATLESYLIYYIDPSPNNINCDNHPNAVLNP
jgi:hypothetical protein